LTYLVGAIHGKRHKMNIPVTNRNFLHLYVHKSVQCLHLYVHKMGIAVTNRNFLHLFAFRGFTKGQKCGIMTHIK